MLEKIKHELLYCGDDPLDGKPIYVTFRGLLFGLVYGLSGWAAEKLGKLSNWALMKTGL